MHQWCQSKTMLILVICRSAALIAHASYSRAIYSSVNSAQHQVYNVKNEHTKRKCVCTLFWFAPSLELHFLHWNAIPATKIPCIIFHCFSLHAILGSACWTIMEKFVLFGTNRACKDNSEISAMMASVISLHYQRNKKSKTNTNDLLHTENSNTNLTVHGIHIQHGTHVPILLCIVFCLPKHTIAFGKLLTRSFITATFFGEPNNKQKYPPPSLILRPIPLPFTWITILQKKIISAAFSLVYVFGSMIRHDWWLTLSFAKKKNCCKHRE